MYVIKTYLDKSPIEGIGVFAGEDVPQGAVVWRLVPGFDLVLAPGPAVENLPERARAHLKRHAYLSAGRLILCADHGQYTNHSETPNTGSADDQDVEYALKPIRKGDEITADYRLFDEESRNGPAFS